MPSRYFGEFRKIGRPKTPPAMGQAGTPGAEAAGRMVQERTAAWPAPGPLSKTPWNRKTKAHVVKTTARRAGIDA